MTDPTALLSALTYVKTALDLVRGIRESDLSLSSADLKNKLADMMSALADAKMSLVDAQDVLKAKDQRIRELEEAFEIKDEMVRQGDAYYRKNASGNAAGEAYCVKCWVDQHKAKPLVKTGNSIKQTNVCSSCGAEYNGHQSHGLASS